ncbi:MAG: PQQ-dependent sugar dehydrogenase [Thermoflexales bacterium]|nr:PQQ-dependent sugar dehydrogenase [Thermoflexales bacterium]
MALRPVLLVVFTFVVIINTSVGVAGGASTPIVPPTPPHVTYQLVPVAAGLDKPVFITHAGDERLFIVEQRGTIRIWHDGSLLPTFFLDIQSIVKCCGEEGLLGLAFEPDYATTGRFYVYHTNPSGDQVVARYTVSSDPNVADPSSRQVVLTIPHPDYENHNGGWIGFGLDGNLYVAVGDGGGAGDPFCVGQNPDDLRGKILRINVVNQVTYTIPAGNVFAPSQRPEVWAYGLRNPWRASFDRVTGAFYIADVGQNAREEVNYLPPSAPAGTDFGWSSFEGTLNYANSCPKKTTGVTFPVIEYDHSMGCSITGGYVYRGQQHPYLQGVYFFGDYCSGRIWAMWSPAPGAPFVSAVVLGPGAVSGLSSFGEDAQGEIYVASYFTGAIFRLSARGPRVWIPTVLQEN